LKKIFDPLIARAARTYTQLGQAALAKEAKVSSRTVWKLEEDGRVRNDSLDKILNALERRGVVMMHDDAGDVWGIWFVRSRNS
jgi:transcriptional regulator with XRE-family HTH domain